MRKKIVVASCLGFVLCMMLAVFGLIRNERNAAEDTDCHNHMTLLAQSMYQYHDKYGHFPPAYVELTPGIPAHSWRVLLLEFLDQEAFDSYDFKEPWNSKNNRTIESRMPRCFRCPSSSTTDHSLTNYFVVTGSHTLFPGTNAKKITDAKENNSNIVMIVESTALTVHWMQPDDIPYELLMKEGFSSLVTSFHPNGANVCMSDGKKIKLASLDPDLMSKIFLLHNR